MPAACLLVAATSSAATLALAWAGRRRALACATSDDDLMAELQRRGVDFEDVAMDRNVRKRYHNLGKLGEGNSGEVYRVRRTADGQVFALKKVYKDGDGRHVNDRDSLRTEIACLRKLQHRHIVNLIEVVESSKTLWIIMECASGGGLYERITSTQHFSEASAARIVKQVLKAVHYMHSMGVVHRDLKAENVLLDSAEAEADIKVADFGLAAELGFTGYHPEESMNLKSSRSVKGAFCGTPICMAPEVAESGAAYGPQCDIWSVGCLLHELLCGQPAYNASSCDELFARVRESREPALECEVWKNVSSDAKSLIRLMLRRSPADRPSAKEALMHAWFMQAPDDHLDEAHSKLLRRASSKRLSMNEEAAAN